jgi:glycosyltransferase involved in cell wall biosynthesis
MKRRKILWLSHFVPYPPKGGCFQRSYNLIKRVAAVHDVHLIAVKHKGGTHPEDEIREARTELLRHCKSVQILDISASTTAPKLALRGLASVLTWSPLTVTIYRSAELRAQVRALVQREKIEAAHFDAISLADYLEDVGDIPTVMTHHGAESFMIRRRIGNEKNLGRKLFFGLEWHMLRHYEARMCPRFSMNVVMSQLDQEILEQIAPRARFTVVANGVDIDYFAPVEGSRRPWSIVFAGRLDQYSNRHGMLRFMNEAWPIIKRGQPDAVIDIIGSNPPKEIEALAKADANVRVHGFVPDVRPFFATASVAICPIWDGGGTRIKVLDGLAQGMPLVATSIGAEGIDVVPERDLLIADTPEQFAAQISRLFTESELRKKLETNGRHLAETVYSWDSIAQRLAALYSP